MVAQSASCDVALNARMIVRSKVFLALAGAIDWSRVETFGIIALGAVLFRSAGSACPVIVTGFAYALIQKEKIETSETKSPIGARGTAGKNFEALMAFSSNERVTVVRTGVTKGFVVSAIGAVFVTLETLHVGKVGAIGTEYVLVDFWQILSKCHNLVGIT